MSSTSSLPPSHPLLWSRRSLLKWLTGASLLALSGCGDSASDRPPAPLPASSPDATATPTLRVAFGTAPRHFDPARMTTDESYHLAFALYESLVWFNADLEMEGLLAESFAPDPAFTVWTFTLRQGIRFSNGADLLAKDVVYTFNRLRDPIFNSPLYPVLRVVEHVEALDDHTVEFSLAGPNVKFPGLLAAPQSGIVPDLATTADLAARPIGAGPFRLLQHTAGQRITMVRNADYWDAENVSVPMLEYVYGLTVEEQAAALKAGRIDILPDIDPRFRAELIADPALTVLEVPSGRYQSVVMNTNEAPFADPRVRQALKLCADRRTLQEKVLLGLGAQAADHPISQLMAEYWADLPIPEYDPAAASQLLAEAGLADKLSLTLITSPSQPGMVELAETFKEMALPAGVEIEVVRVPPDVYWSHYAGKAPFHVSHWNFRPSIDDIMTSGFHSASDRNESHWQDETFDQLIDAARSEANDQKRQELYRQAQMRIMEHGAVIIPYFRPVLMAMRSTIQGFLAHPSGWIDFYGVQVN